MTSPTPHFTPLPTGGSLVGNTYISTFAGCPRDWFNRFYRPFEDCRGIQYKFRSPFLLAGGTFHVGMEHLYRSGCRDGDDTGEWNLDTAMDQMQVAHSKAEAEYESPERADEDWLLCQEMLIAYHDRFGPAGPTPDYPTIRVLHDDSGQPLIERELRVELGYRDFIFTSKPDVLILHHGRPKVMEHKTSAPGMWAKERIRKIHTDSQFTGECFCLLAQFPDLPIDGVLCNVIIKRGRSETCLRDTTRRSLADLEVFRLSTLDILQQIDHRVAQYEESVRTGTPPEQAVSMWFPDHGTRTGQCEAFKGCEFQTLCLNKDRTAENLRNYRGRSPVEVQAQMENPG